jgi:hypothetical protein
MHNDFPHTSLALSHFTNETMSKKENPHPLKPPHATFSAAKPNSPKFSIDPRHIPKNLRVNECVATHSKCWKCCDIFLPKFRASENVDEISEISEISAIYTTVEQTSQDIHSLLREYEDLFPKTFSEIKGIQGGLGEMEIELKPGSKPVRHRSYRLNPRVKEKVKREIDKMLEARLIFPVEEAEWVSPIVIQSKKGIEDSRVCVDYRSLNFACVHDPFPTPFTDKVLEQVAGKESYSFTDGFSVYHQGRITEEDKKKTTFITEWGSFAYNLIPFGLKNAL